MDSAHDIVARLIAEGADRPPSRNQHFHEWSSPEHQAAYRLFWRLIDIERDLQAVATGQGRVVLTEDEHGARTLAYALDLPQGPARRTARLQAPEWELLRRMCGPMLDELLAS